MDKKHQPNRSKDTQNDANYNPTARNFDHSDVSGKPYNMSSKNQRDDDRDEDLDPLPEETREMDSDKS